jgi:hypothetical protein
MIHERRRDGRKNGEEEMWGNPQPGRKETKKSKTTATKKPLREFMVSDEYDGKRDIVKVKRCGNSKTREIGFWGTLKIAKIKMRGRGERKCKLVVAESLESVQKMIRESRV